MPDGAPSMAEASAGFAAALADASVEAPAAVEATPEVIATTPNVETAPTEVPETPATESFNLDGVDLSGLSEADLAKVKNAVLRQQDYTKKTQEVAPYRKFMEESNADLDKVRQSYDFVSRLENDKEFLAQVAQELTDLAKGDVVTEQPNATLEAPSSDPNLVRTVNELNEWKANQVREAENAEIVRQWEVKIQTAENAIRESNPSYGDDDIKALYDILPAHEYDMFAAQEWMEKYNNALINRTLKPKINHPNAANPVNAGALSTSPKDVTTFEQAAAITRERLRQEA